MANIKWVNEKSGAGPYQHVACGYQIEMEDSPIAKALKAEADYYERRMNEALDTNLFLTAETE